MILHFLTFNLGETKKYSKKQFIQNMKLSCWDFVTENDVWIISTQEDNIESKFISALHKTKFPNFKKIDIYDSSMDTGFCVHLAIFHPRQIKIVSETDSKSHGHVFFWKNDKGSSIFSTKDIAFVGAHLPFLKFTEMYNSDRKRAMKSIINHEKMRDKIFFVLGDLNFRKHGKTDQLDRLLKNLYAERYSLGEMNKLQKIIPDSVIDLSSGLAPTCKTISTNGECDKVFTDSKYKVTSTRKKQCYHTKRTPSNCDKILLFNNTKRNVNFKILKKQVIICAPIDQSDHNAVYVKIDLEKMLIF